jgi:hydroxymethylbilane synthase
LKADWFLCMKLKLGARISKLALTQAGLVADALTRVHSSLEVEVVQISTRGDMKQDTPQAASGDKRDWIHEIELALVRGAVDFAVHSGKDMPALFSEETELLPVLKRENPCDLFLGKRDAAAGQRLRFAALPGRAVVGCASLRRRAQLLRLKPGLQFVDHRGNVPTRIERLDQSETLSGIVLAAAGVHRLGLKDMQPEDFSTAQVLPAMNQGILTAQVRRDRPDVRELLSSLEEPGTRACFEAERACVNVLNADCHSSVAIFAQTFGRRVRLVARVLSVDGAECVEVIEQGRLEDAGQIGKAAAAGLLNRGAARLILEASRLKAGYFRE